MLKKIIPWILVAMSLALNVYFRFFTQIMPSMDAAARQEVYDGELKLITEALDKDYPSTESVSRAALAKKMFRQDLKDSRAMLEAKISERSAEMKDRYRSEGGFAYMSGIDSYYWLRYLKNILATGHVGDQIVNGVAYDDLMSCEVDPATRHNIHLGLGVILAKAARVLAPGVPLEAVLFYLPVILTALIAVVVFLVACRLGASDLGAFMACFVVHLSPFLLLRSTEEWFDTDIYSVLFPLLAFGSLLSVFRSSMSWAKRGMLCLASGFFLACYASTWKGWWFIFDVMLLSGFLFLLNQKLSQKEEGIPDALLRAQGVSFIFFAIATSFLVIVTCGVSAWNDFISEPMRLAHILKVSAASLWPNVYLTVAELGPASAIELVRGCGGAVVFFGALAVFFFIFTFERGLRDNDRGFGFLVLVTWICLTFYAAREANRFTLLLIIPTGIGFGLFFTRVCARVAAWTSAWKSKPAAISVRLATVGLFSLQIILQANIVQANLFTARPFMDDYWQAALARVKTETSKDAVIASWWDYGHWFKAIGQRRVIFDGMTQNTPKAYWIAQVLLSDDERYAANVLRMVSGSGNKAGEILINKGKYDVNQSVAFIRSALAKDSAGALEELSGKLPTPLAHEVLAALFPAQTPPVYFILSYDMVDKVGPISFIGNWDFKKVDLYFKSRQLPQDDFIAYVREKLNVTAEIARFKWMEITALDEKASRAWYSTIEGYYSPMTPSTRWEGLDVFDNNLVMFSGNKSAIIATDIKSKKGRPKSVVYMENGALKEVAQEAPTLDFSAVLVDKKGVPNSLFASPALAKSMLLRLYFYKGEGLKYFKPWHQEVDDEGKGIYIYEMHWPE
jgi:asparagine N-glycosylation enzyme membrane subunit Stt3